jgi:hypothetical protein
MSHALHCPAFGACINRLITVNTGTDEWKLVLFSGLSEAWGRQQTSSGGPEEQSKAAVEQGDDVTDSAAPEHLSPNLPGMLGRAVQTAEVGTTGPLSPRRLRTAPQTPYAAMETLSPRRSNCGGARGWRFPHDGDSGQDSSFLTPHHHRRRISWTSGLCLGQVTASTPSDHVKSAPKRP